MSTTDKQFMLDSGATVHIANTRTVFDTYHPFTHARRIMVGKRGQFIVAHGEGTLSLDKLHLNNVWFCPDCPFNVVSTHQLTGAGMRIEMEGDIAAVLMHGECLHMFAKDSSNGLCVSSSFVNKPSHSTPSSSRPPLCFGAFPLPASFGAFPLPAEICPDPALRLCPAAPADSACVSMSALCEYVQPAAPADSACVTNLCHRYVTAPPVGHLHLNAAKRVSFNDTVYREPQRLPQDTVWVPMHVDDAPHLPSPGFTLVRRGAPRSSHHRPANGALPIALPIDSDRKSVV